MSAAHSSSFSTSVGRVFKRSLRLFWFFLKVGVGLLGILWLSQIPGDVVVRLAGYEIQVTLSFAMAILALFLAAMWFCIGLLKGLFGFTNFWKERRARRHRRIADTCLKNGLFAFFAEDYTLTLAQLRRAIKYDPARKGVFEAVMGVAALNNDQNDLAREYFEDLAKDNSNRFMGYFGLYHLDPEKAVPLLERAVKDLPDNVWILKRFRAVLLPLAKGGDLEVIHTIQELTEKLYDLKGINRHERNEQRGEALWFLALYYKAKNDEEKALQLAKESYDLHPALTGPVTMLAEHKDTYHAQKLLMKAFAQTMAPELAQTIVKLLPKTEETFHAFEQHFSGNDAPQVMFLLALLAYNAKLWGRSKQLLIHIPEEKRDSHYYLLLAKLAEADLDVHGIKKHSESALLRVVK